MEFNWRNVAIMAAIALILYAAACLVLFVSQRSMIYYPTPKVRANADTLTLQVNDEKILISTRPRAGTNAVIYFGGNAEDVSASLPTLEQAFPESALYALHYPGYGGSSGKPSESALLAAGFALFERVHAEHASIVLVGRSLGSGVAVHLASERPVSRLVLVTPYDSLEGIAARQFSYFPIRWLMLDKFESWRYAPHVIAPTLLIAAEHDEVIPLHSTESLYRHFKPGVATLTIVKGVGHNSVSESADYIPLLNDTAIHADVPVRSGASSAIAR
jgi:pimeloyl-ACP methyl ester carboxylesterase